MNIALGYPSYTQLELEAKKKCHDRMCDHFNEMTNEAIILLKELTYTTSLKTIVSVGSGTGYVEKKLMEACQLSITCIDPNPGEWNFYEERTIHVTPEYDIVSSYVSATNRDTIDLLIIWWSYGRLDYDYEAIQALNPKHILIGYDRNRAAGGGQLHTFLRRCQKDLSMKDSFFGWSELDPTDKVKGSDYSAIRVDCGSQYFMNCESSNWYTVVLLSRK